MPQRPEGQHRRSLRGGRRYGAAEVARRRLVARRATPRSAEAAGGGNDESIGVAAIAIAIAGAVAVAVAVAIAVAVAVAVAAVVAGRGIDLKGQREPAHSSDGGSRQASAGPSQV